MASKTFLLRDSLTSYRVFSLTWPASMQIYWNKRKRLHKKGVQLPEDWFGTPTWPPFHCFRTPIWPPWRHVKTLYRWPLKVPWHVSVHSSTEGFFAQFSAVFATTSKLAEYLHSWYWNSYHPRSFYYPRYLWTLLTSKQYSLGTKKELKLRKRNVTPCLFVCLFLLLFLLKMPR